MQVVEKSEKKKQANTEMQAAKGMRRSCLRKRPTNKKKNTKKNDIDQSIGTVLNSARSHRYLPPANIDLAAERTLVRGKTFLSQNIANKYRVYCYKQNARRPSDAASTVDCEGSLRQIVIFDTRLP